MSKLILRSHYSPGDIVMLTGAVRELHRCYPKQFQTDVRTSCPELWENNPRLTPLHEEEPGVMILNCHYPLIKKSNEGPYHCLHGYIEFLNDQLGLQIRPALFKGDIHLTEEEKRWDSQVHELTGEDTPFWLIASGGKFDVTLKWWEPRRYQEVVNRFAGRIQFVQVGAAHHHHPPLQGVIDLRGRTSLRQLIRLVYHAQGILCPVTCLMHLAAAIETKPGAPPNRPCVVIAGGREPPQWEAYPFHQFIHTVGALPCCTLGGCWRARVQPLGLGDENDQPDRLCLDARGNLPRCMDMIDSAEVIRRVAHYFEGGVISYLSKSQHRAARNAVSLTREGARSYGNLRRENARLAAEVFINTIPSYPARHRHQDRGIVMCAGGTTLYANAWIAIHMLRHWGCQLPIEVWHLGHEELDRTMAALLRPLGVRCVNAHVVRKGNPVRTLRGWELKVYAIIHSRFQEVLLLDADNMPVRNPEFLFGTPEYRRHRAIFWPDYRRLPPNHAIWSLCGIAYRDEPEVESGQIVVDKKACWRPLQLCLWYNEHSDFFYKHIHGDKETYHLAWRKLEQSYAMPSHPIENLSNAVMCQHDFEGRRLFQHRNLAKWKFWGENPRIPGFLHEDRAREYLQELRNRWPGKPPFPPRRKTSQEKSAAAELLNRPLEYHRIGHEARHLTFLPDGRVGSGGGTEEVFWDIKEQNGDMVLEVYSGTGLTCSLTKQNSGKWCGRWVRFEQMPVELMPVGERDGVEGPFQPGLPSARHGGFRASESTRDNRSQGEGAPLSPGQIHPPPV